MASRPGCPPRASTTTSSTVDSGGPGRLQQHGGAARRLRCSRRSPTTAVLDARSTDFYADATGSPRSSLLSVWPLPDLVGPRLEPGRPPHVRRRARPAPSPRPPATASKCATSPRRDDLRIARTRRRRTAIRSTRRRDALAGTVFPDALLDSKVTAPPRHGSTASPSRGAAALDAHGVVEPRASPPPSTPAAGAASGRPSCGRGSRRGARPARGRVHQRRRRDPGS